MAVKYAKKSDILKQVGILSIVDEFSINTEEAFSDSFDLRCRCPSPEHKQGNERTPSCYINLDENSFYCFGCNKGTNVIDFYMLCTGLTFVEALKELKKRVDLGKVSASTSIPKEDNLKYIMEISKLFRDTMKKNSDDLKWINSIMKRTDLYLEDINRYDVKKVKRLFEKLDKKIKERYSE